MDKKVRVLEGSENIVLLSIFHHHNLPLAFPGKKHIHIHMYTHTHTHTHTHTCNSSKTLIGVRVHEMHNISNAPQLKSCNYFLAHDPLSSLAYPMITNAPLVAGSLPIKALIARQQLTNTHTHIHTHTTCTHACMHKHTHTHTHTHTFCATHQLNS